MVSRCRLLEASSPARDMLLATAHAVALCTASSSACEALLANTSTAGNVSCPCISSLEAFGINKQCTLTVVCENSSYGVGCIAHDATRPPHGIGLHQEQPELCFQPWCYVNGTACMASGVAPVMYEFSWWRPSARSDLHFSLIAGDSAIHPQTSQSMRARRTIRAAMWRMQGCTRLLDARCEGLHSHEEACVPVLAAMAEYLDVGTAGCAAFRMDGCIEAYLTRTRTRYCVPRAWKPTDWSLSPGICVNDATINPHASDAPPPSAAGAVRADQSAWHTRHMRRMRMPPARAVVRPHARADDAVLTRARAVGACAARIFF